ncbi:MAG TPA: adenylate kinase [Anaerolineales bacterium]|uniref:Adenylate kinase n=1 Tax=uncultured Chloroflexi bacterium Rifle_16ft_4_minimus_6153 TaxID=1665079 RepID=A0A0H4TCE6_9CHLR|nr:adk, adenylate kinase, adenylate kinase [uncultured Chloroflexi bacterium Rifle_16ft_4_minimus_6153]HLE30595.1 adenylate kinase [Anaerolineales bacterium]
MPNYILLLGGPGAGKGTQAQHLCQKFGLPQVASGDLFRDNLKRQTPLGQLARTYMDKGALVPDDVTIQMIRERLSQPDARPGALLDGFPRTVPQAEALDGLLAEFGGKVNVVLYVKVRDGVLLERLSGRWTCRGPLQHTYHLLFNPPKVAGKCDVDGTELFQRPDDTPEVQAKRIKVFFEQTAPLIAFYTRRGQLVEIDGEKSIAEVTAALITAAEAASAP